MLLLHSGSRSLHVTDLIGRCLVSLSRHELGVSFGVSVCVLLLTLAVCYCGQLQVSVVDLQRQSLRSGVALTA